MRRFVLSSRAICGKLKFGHDCMTVQALFIDPNGPYPKLLGMENCWDEQRDARTYPGTDPVIAHPPCHRWVNLAAVNYKRYQRQLPAWYPGGDDEGCFKSALTSVRKYGGVIEHPAFTHAWAKHYIDSPACIDRDYRGWFENYWAGGTSGPGGDTYYTCEVWQSAYGHLARKRTWLLYCGSRPPFELNWTREPGTCQIGWFDRNKKTLSKKEASRTPEAFAKELIKLAEWSRDPVLIGPK
jgi:hypothetical protein